MATVQDLEVTPKLWNGEEFRRLQDLRLISRAAELRGGAVFEAGRPRRWTGAELYRLLDLGFFTGQRVELLEGDIVEMAAQKAARPGPFPFTGTPLPLCLSLKSARRRSSTTAPQRAAFMLG